MTSRRVFVLCEDSAADTRRAVLEVVRKALHLIEPGWENRESGPTLQLEEGTAVAQAWRSQAWTDRRRGQKARIVAQFLGEKLHTGDIVILHYDGDRAWTDPDVAPVCDLRQRVDALLATVEAWTDARGVILRLVPHYSIESWLYLNVKALPGPDARPDLRSAHAWLKDNFSETTGYDHVDQPKDACPLRSRLNGDLSRAWSAKKAERHSPSFRATLSIWRGDERLTLALAPSCLPGA